jgi:hypothetical protein
MLSDFAGGAHRIEDAGHDLRRPRPAHIINCLDLKEFRVGKDDSELIVQAVKQQPKLGIDRWRVSRACPAGS